MKNQNTKYFNSIVKQWINVNGQYQSLLNLNLHEKKTSEGVKQIFRINSQTKIFQKKFFQCGDFTKSTPKK